jgi:hypothetical protein
MPRTIHTIAAALAALVIAAPTALARPIEDPVGTSSLAGTTSSPKQDLRSPDARDAARPKTRADVTAALAQERYYASYGDPTPITPPAGAPAIDTGDGIAQLPFILAVSGALIFGLATGSGLHLLHARRRRATSLAT